MNAPDVPSKLVQHHLDQYGDMVEPHEDGQGELHLFLEDREEDKKCMAVFALKTQSTGQKIIVESCVTDVKSADARTQWTMGARNISMP
eukprot:5232643-Karenia_brevis.AAC.1